MKLIVGLGNPEKKYDYTRHNIGFYIIDNYLKDDVFKNKFDALYLEKTINNEKVIFVKPLTYMNNSGFAVLKFVEYYNVLLKDVLIIHDDLDLPVGCIKFKFNSSSGGHNGIKSIINQLGSQEFFRMKIGINNNNNNTNTINFVLGKFSKDDLSLIDLNKCNNAINDFILNDYNYVMNKYNGNE